MALKPLFHATVLRGMSPNKEPPTHNLETFLLPPGPERPQVAIVIPNTGVSPSVFACWSPAHKFLVSSLGAVRPPFPPPKDGSSALFDEQLLRAVQFLLDDSEACAQRQGLAVARDQGGVGRTQQPLDLGPEARVQTQHQGQLKGGH